ncbi:lymphocyte antigen 6B-like [Lytechinus variegatus]|uniref:lymphocyte antigen 6B-like n=1 Tax=Lytechinus variegatus TaxID=7654 RepID=UPI001BB0FCF2|nr:lymphocyte antigen 6B-like [Lytechinus variegatus]
MKTFITLFVLAACVAPLYALDCYSCGYVTGGGADCLDTFDTSTLNSSSDVTTATCSGQCSKTTVTVNSAVTAQARACVASCTGGCISLFGIRTCTNCCSTDYCNSATNVQMSIIAMMAALLLALGISR